MTASQSRSSVSRTAAALRSTPNRFCCNTRRLRAVSVSARGGWRLQAASAAAPLSIELGRDEPDARLARFVAAYARTVGALARSGTRVADVDVAFTGDIATTADAQAITQREGIRSDWGLPVGRPFTQSAWDSAKADALLAHWVDLDDVDAAFVCGPEGMMEAVTDALRARGFPDAKIKVERFAASIPRHTHVVPDVPRVGHAECEATVVIDGATRTFTLEKGKGAAPAKLKLVRDALAAR